MKIPVLKEGEVTVIDNGDTISIFYGELRHLWSEVFKYSPPTFISEPKALDDEICKYPNHKRLVASKDYRLNTVIKDSHWLVTSSMVNLYINHCSTPESRTVNSDNEGEMIELAYWVLLEKPKN